MTMKRNVLRFPSCSQSSCHHRRQPTAASAPAATGRKGGDRHGGLTAGCQVDTGSTDGVPQVLAVARRRRAGTAADDRMMAARCGVGRMAQVET